MMSGEGLRPAFDPRDRQATLAVDALLLTTATGLIMYRATIGQRRYVFGDLKTVLGKASPARSGDRLAGVAAESFEERVAA
jgi:hypothetical protein